MPYSGEQSKTALDQAHTMEHRWGARLPCRIAVRVSGRGGDPSIGQLRNVSMTGAFLETPHQFPLFAHIELTIIPDEAHSHRETAIHAVVVRMARDGAGVEWREPAAGSICALLGCTTRCSEPHSTLRQSPEHRSGP